MDGTPRNMNALFLHDPADLDAPVPGGVQLCTREFLDVVQAAADRTVLFPVHRSRRLPDRLRRRFSLRPYSLYHPAGDAAALTTVLRENAITHIFINRTELMRYGAQLKALNPTATIVLMSHGNQSGDDLYEIAGRHGRRNQGAAALRATWHLGRDLVAESRERHRAVDIVAVMSDEEAVLERWLGAARVVVLPRRIEPKPLELRPVSGRVGYVGTLNHTPNLAALQDVGAALQGNLPSPFELRLVGSPETVGRELAARFPFVTYCGRLDDQALAAEASTWSLFLNPILWLSRGASMKLGTGLSWGLPVVSTRSGIRGYEWSDGDVAITDDNAGAFAHEIVRLLSSTAELKTLATASRVAGQSGPTTALLATRLRGALGPTLAARSEPKL